MHWQQRLAFRSGQRGRRKRLRPHPRLLRQNWPLAWLRT